MKHAINYMFLTLITRVNLRQVSTISFHHTVCTPHVAYLIALAVKLTKKRNSLQGTRRHTQQTSVELHSTFSIRESCLLFSYPESSHFFVFLPHLVISPFILICLILPYPPSQVHIAILHKLKVIANLLCN